MAMLQRQDQVLAEVIYRLEHQHKPPRSWSKDGSLRSYKRLHHQLHIRNGVLYKERYVVLPGGRREKKEAIVISSAVRHDVLKEVHDKAGQMGVEKILARLEKRGWWPGYTTDVMNWVRCCGVCARRKGPAVNPRAPVMSVPIGSSMEMLVMGILGPLPVSNKGNRYLLVISDYYTKWPEVFPLPNQKATTVAKVLYNEMILRFGVPLVLHIDQGSNYDGSVMRELCSLLGMKKAKTTPYHP